MKNIDYIFCDLDLTLLDDDKKISSKNLEAIKKARLQGTRFIITTGRMPFLVKRLQEELEYDNDDYAICANGAILKRYNGDILFKYSIDLKDAQILQMMAEKYNLGLFVSSINEIYCFNASIIRQGQKTHINPDELNGEQLSNFLIENEIYKISLVHPSDFSLLKVAEEELNVLCGNNISKAYSDKTTIETVGKGRTKGQGIIDFCKYKGTDLKRVLAIGDNLNDVSMFDVAYYSAAPSNCEKDVQDKVAYVAKNDNNNSAIAEIIEKLVLKES